MPSYSKNIPQPDDIVAISQDALLQNFQSLDALYGQDHYNWDDADVNKRAHHRYVSCIEQAGDPPTVANQGQLYTKDVSGKSELFFKDSSGSVIQFSSGGGGSLPIRAYCTGKIDFAGIILLSPGSFNVASFTLLSIPASQFVLTMTTPPPSINYGVAFGCSGLIQNPINPIALAEYIQLSGAETRTANTMTVGFFQPNVWIPSVPGPPTSPMIRFSILIYGG